MFGFVKKAFKSVGRAAASVTKLAKPVAAGVAIVYPPAAPIAAGVFVADKALDAVNTPTKGAGLTALVQRIAQQRAAQGKPPVPAPQLAAAVQQKAVQRKAAGVRILANTAALASKGDQNAARMMTLVTKRAAARREAKHWRFRNGRVVRV